MFKINKKDRLLSSNMHQALKQYFLLLKCFEHLTELVFFKILKDQTFDLPMRISNTDIKQNLLAAHTWKCDYLCEFGYWSIHRFIDKCISN